MTDFERIEKVIKYINAHKLDQPKAYTLARVAGLSESHLHRLFTRWAGTTPKSFLQFLTATHAKKLLQESRDILDVSLDVGLSGPSRLHDLIIKTEAVTPGEFKSKGNGLEIKYGFHSTPFGMCLIGVTSRGICHLAFTDSTKTSQKNSLEELKVKWANAKIKESKVETKKILNNIFESSKKTKISILLSGTPFQLKVWEALIRIPSGCVTSYSDIASMINNPKASRAVGSAVGSNNIAFLIPCHRVIRETGAFGQYKWGSERKNAILVWENSKIK